MLSDVHVCGKLSSCIKCIYWTPIGYIVLEKVYCNVVVDKHKHTHKNIYKYIYTSNVVTIPIKRVGIV